MAMVVPSLASPAGATVGGTGLGFDGVSQYAKLGVATDLRSSVFTVELWFRRTGAGVATSTGSGGLPSVIPLITKGRSQSESAAADINYFLGINATTGALVADFEEAQTAAGGVTAGANHPVSGTTAIPADGVWHHAAGTYDGSSWSLYLDGLKEAGLFVGVPANAETTAVAAVGSALQTTGNPAGFFAGDVDEVRVWATARTQAEISSAKDADLTGSPTGLLGVWHLNEGYGTQVRDQSVSNLSGTTVNDPPWVTGAQNPEGNVSPTVATLVTPANASNGVGLAPTLSVAVADPNGGTVIVTYLGRPLASGPFRPITFHTGVSSGTTDSTVWSALAVGQSYEWYAVVSDGFLSTTSPTWTFHTAPGSDPIFTGAGDIADCNQDMDAATAAILSGIDGTVWTSGDNVYPAGLAEDFANCYDPVWGGSIKARTRPVPGNHDWGDSSISASLSGYKGYFGAQATDANGKSYYSYNIASSNWHIVNLDSECGLVTPNVADGCAAGSPQETWLRADLASNSTKNVVAIWHRPLYSSGGTHYTALQAMYTDLYEAGADLILQGHDHIYERTAPTNPDGAADLNYGIRQFTVGTGGSLGSNCGNPIPTQEVCKSNINGVLKLTLHATGYDWAFLATTDSSFTDSGTGTVHPAPVAPAAAQIGTATAGVASATVTWAAPIPNGGPPVTGYVITPYLGTTAQTPTVVGVVTSAVVTGLTNSSEYTFKVAATNEFGVGPQSSASNSVTPTEPIVVPGAPTIGIATARSTEATVHWTAPLFDGGSAITGYVVTPYIGTTAQTPRSVGVVTSLVLTGLANGTTYSFTVAARNVLGTGAPSAISNAVTPAAVPSAPTGVVAKPGLATATAGSLLVSFIPGASNGSAILTYVATCTSTQRGVAAVNATGTTSPITISGAATSKRFTCRVTATNSIGTSAASAASAEVIVGSPAAPTAVAAVKVASGQLRVTFTPGASNGSSITSYKVTCRSSNAGVSKSATGTVSPITVTRLTAAKTYTCVVTATNARGVSLASVASLAVVA